MLPTARSSALKAARPYCYLLGCNLSPALCSYVNSFLRQLKAIDRSLSEEPLRPGTLRDAETLARVATAAHKTACPACHLVHTGECL
jgi:hypothetical protein